MIFGGLSADLLDAGTHIVRFGRWSDNNSITIVGVKGKAVGGFGFHRDKK